MATWMLPFVSRNGPTTLMAIFRMEVPLVFLHLPSNRRPRSFTGLTRITPAAPILEIFITNHLIKSSSDLVQSFITLRCALDLPLCISSRILDIPLALPHIILSKTLLSIYPSRSGHHFLFSGIKLVQYQGDSVAVSYITMLSTVYLLVSHFWHQVSRFFVFYNNCPKLRSELWKFGVPVLYHASIISTYICDNQVYEILFISFGLR